MAKITAHEVLTRINEIRQITCRETKQLSLDQIVEQHLEGTSNIRQADNLLCSLQERLLG